MCTLTLSPLKYGVQPLCYHTCWVNNSCVEFAPDFDCKLAVFEHVLAHSWDYGMLMRVVYSIFQTGSRNLTRRIWSALFDPCAVGQKPFWWSHMEVSYCTSRFGEVIQHDLLILSLVQVLLCDNLIHAWFKSRRKRQHMQNENAWWA